MRLMFQQRVFNVIAAGVESSDKIAQDYLHGMLPRTILYSR